MTTNIKEIATRLGVPLVALIFLIFILDWLRIFDEFLDILRVVVWPVVIFLALIYFRKVFFYLFLSLDEFNFFGAKGELRDVSMVINEKVEKEIERRKREEEYEAKRKTFEEHGVADETVRNYIEYQEELIEDQRSRIEEQEQIIETLKKGGMREIEDMQRQVTSLLDYARTMQAELHSRNDTTKSTDPAH